MLNVDLSEICDVTAEHARTYQPVAVTEFQRDEKHLYYINAHHVSGTDNPTCKTVQQSITRFNPDLVIVEGGETGTENNGFVKFVHEQAAKSGFKLGGETAYAAHLAMENNIPFIGGEPSDKTIFSCMKEKGYSAKEVMAFYLLRQIPQWRREGVLGESTFAERATKHLEHWRRASGTPGAAALSFEEFTRWYDKHNTTGKTFLEIDNEDVRPTNAPADNYFRKLHYRLTAIRERHVDTVIGNSFTDHDRVLVVYGDGHFRSSRRVFEKALGPGTTFQLA